MSTLVPAPDIKIDRRAGKIVITDMIRQELVGGTTQLPYLDVIRGLSPWVDDVERDFGLNIYDLMDNYPAVKGGLNTLTTKVFENGVQIVPSVDAGVIATTDEKNDAEEAKRIADMVQWAVSDMEIPLNTILPVIYRSGLKQGHKLCEKVFWDELRPYNGSLKLSLRCLDPKPREVYRLDVDRHNRIRHIQAIIPGVGLMLQEGMIPGDMPNMITPDKFCILTFYGEDRNPLGKSHVRAAYNSWYLVMQDWPLMLKNREQYAGGQLVITVSESNSNMPADPAGKLDPYAYLAQTAAASFRSGAVIVLPFGCTAEVFRANGTTDIFWNDVDGHDRQIWVSLLNQSRGNKEAEHGSKADSGNANDTTDSLVKLHRSLVSSIIEEQLFKTIVRLNEGDEAAERFTPKLNLSGVPKEDWPENMKAAAAAGLQLSPTQMAQVSQDKLGLHPDLEHFQEADRLGKEAQASSLEAKNNPKTPEKEKEKEAA